MLKKNKENNSKIKQFIKKHKTKIIVIICMLFSGIVSAAAATTIFASSEVSYSNSSSGMSATNVQDAIDELWEEANIPKASSAGLRVVYAYHTDQKTIGTSTITNGVSNYTQLSTYSTKKFFLKYEIDSSNVIRKAYACTKFNFISEPVCMQGGINESSLTDQPIYNANKAALTSLQSTFNSNSGSCYFSTSNSGSSCYTDDLEIIAYFNGVVFANAYDANDPDSDPIESCNVVGTGKACFVW